MFSSYRNEFGNTMKKMRLLAAKLPKMALFVIFEALLG
jgi:hypothetical protein